MGEERRLPAAVPGRQKKGFEVQEARVAAALPGGTQVRGSGCSRRADRKSDVTSRHVRVESKTTSGKSIRVERAWCDKITHEAMTNGQHPALAFGFDGPPRLDWMAFPIDVAEKMVKVLAAVLAGDMREAEALAEMLRNRS